MAELLACCHSEPAEGRRRRPDGAGGRRICSVHPG